MSAYIWLIILAVLVLIEIITVGLTTIWFAAGALVAFLASLFGADLILQLILFVIVSVLMLIFLRPMVAQKVNGNRISTNVNSAIGKEAKVIETIDNFNQKGACNLQGQVWSARNAVSDQQIPEGASVIVKSVEGVKLIVEKKEEE